MRDSTSKYIAAFGGLGLSAAVWAVNQHFKEPPEWLVYMVGGASIILLTMALLFFFWGDPKPKPLVVDALFDLAVRADALIKEKVLDVTDKVLYEMKVKQWIDDVEKILNEEIIQEEAYMFRTTTPMFTKDEQPAVYQILVARRLEKLRLITGRYFKGENIK